ncbi:hypothetical protein PHLGIDRAFT_470359 [Phlebiopsis gigantea 11061_1 CR5-6]|uniref:Uncharacterized protein n=1 Tax=Phlebiopsis gigantea (strain 11061_1 CR5-6) TaxID=745531 RepID=A0A0C3PJ51_PHLG1|nr:hypothetical protein PHLGIDRAFT_470359 [Phlebiopsis gigantea 11061_1 CR5-6]
MTRTRYPLAMKRPDESQTQSTRTSGESEIYSRGESRERSKVGLFIHILSTMVQRCRPKQTVRISSCVPLDAFPHRATNNRELCLGRGFAVVRIGPTQAWRQNTCRGRPLVRLVLRDPYLDILMGQCKLLPTAPQPDNCRMPADLPVQSGVKHLIKFRCTNASCSASALAAPTCAHATKPIAGKDRTHASQS